MIEINLLPWREAVRTRQQKILKQLLISSVLAIISFIIILHYFLSYRLIDINARITNLQKDLEMINKKKDKIDGDNMQQVIRYGANLNALWLALNKTDLTGICYIEIARVKNKIYFKGYARSTVILLHYLEELRVAHFFSEIQLHKLVQQNYNLHFYFSAVEKETDAI